MGAHSLWEEEMGRRADAFPIECLFESFAGVVHVAPSQRWGPPSFQDSFLFDSSLSMLCSRASKCLSGHYSHGLEWATHILSVGFSDVLLGDFLHRPCKHG